MRPESSVRNLSRLAVLLFVFAIALTPLVVMGEGAATRSAPSDPFGVFLWPSGDKLVGASEVAAAGPRWANIHLNWSDVESSPGQYRWDKWDAILRDATVQGYEVLLTVTGNPAWAAETTCGPIRSQYLPAFSDFLTAAAQRYRSFPYKVSYWALYNEPDNGDPISFEWLGGCWGASHPNHAGGAGGAAYATMLSHAYPAIKAGNPDAKVLMGGLAYDNWWHFPSNEDRGPFDAEFLDDLLAAGGANYFDFINFHYYPAWANVWTDPSDRYNSNIISKARYLQDEVLRVTGQKKPVVCSEVGRPTDGPEDDALEYSDELTADYVLQVYARAMYAGIHPLIWLQGVDEGWQERKYGLLRGDLSPKMAFSAYRTLTEEFSGTRHVSARLDFSTNIEGYDLDVAGRTKTILWTVDASSGTQSFATLVGAKLRVVDRLGDERLVEDGGSGDLDGARNGRVVLAIDGSPRIVEDLGLAGVTPTPTATPTPASVMYMPTIRR